MPITIFDGIVIGVVLFSAVLAMVRGFSREILSIASWGGSAAAAYYLYPYLLPYAKKYTDDDRIAIVGSAAVVFLIALIVISFITMKIADFIIDSRVGAARPHARLPVRGSARRAAPGRRRRLLELARRCRPPSGLGQRSEVEALPGFDGREAEIGFAGAICPDDTGKHP